jgi:predicted transglutaminase-like cysteine proteinase
MMAHLFGIVAACALLLAGSPVFAAEMPPEAATLFGAREKETDNINTFYKWTALLARFGQQQTPALWQRDDDKLRPLPLTKMASRVNRIVNGYAYISDEDQQGRAKGSAKGTQVWKTPQDFLTRGGGSCQDFAIAKFLWLEHLGVPPGALRLAIVYDKRSGEPHAVTLVYDDDAILVLDNRAAWWRQNDQGIAVDATGNVTVQGAVQETSRHDTLAASGR